MGGQNNNMWLHSLPPPPFSYLSISHMCSSISIFLSPSLYRVIFSQLIVSQPGPIELKISTFTAQNSPAIDTSRNSNKVTLSISKLTIAENPAMKESEKCLFLFSDIITPLVTSSGDEDHWTNSFPFEVGMLPASYYLKVLTCTRAYDLWGVLTAILPSGVTYVRFRYGIDAVWTGRGLPREEMTYYERLGLHDGITDSKEIRRAYHKKSLQWHPDRWSALTGNTSSLTSELYSLAVKGAFELIAEAYLALSSGSSPAD